LYRENSSGAMSVKRLTPSLQLTSLPLALCAWIAARLAANTERDASEPSLENSAAKSS